MTNSNWFMLGISLILVAVMLAVNVYNKLPKIDAQQIITVTVLFRFGTLLSSFYFLVIMFDRLAKSLISIK